MKETKTDRVIGPVSSIPHQCQICGLIQSDDSDLGYFFHNRYWFCSNCLLPIVLEELGSCHRQGLEAEKKSIEELTRVIVTSRETEQELWKRITLLEKTLELTKEENHD